MLLNNQYKNFPFSYYCPQIIEDFKESLAKTFENLKIETEAPKEEVMSLAEEIEKKIRTKYNLLLPALFMEIKSGENEIVFVKDDLKKVIGFLFSSL
jgi:hypothetical protein